jgi:hypothetical protein
MFYLPKYFANGSFNPVPCYCIAYFFRYDDSQSFSIQTIWNRKNGAQFSNALLFTFGKNFLKLRSFCKPFEFGKRVVTHYFRFSGGQAFSSFSSAISKNTSATNGSTSFSETVYAFSFDIAGLKCSFHQSFLLKNMKIPHLSTKSDV